MSAPGAGGTGAYGAGATQHPVPDRSTGSDGSDDRSIGQIVADIAKDLGTLVRQEIELAKTEITVEAKKAGKGVGMLGGAGVAGNLFLVFVSLALMWLLDRVMPLDLAALLVALIWAAVAAFLAMSGRKHLQSVDPKLEATTQTIKEDVQWAKHPTG